MWIEDICWTIKKLIEVKIKSLTITKLQKTRYISFTIDFDINQWAAWAEKENIDGRGINFCLSNPEVFNKQGDVQTVNPRSMVTFLNTISGLDDWENPDNLAFILNIAKGCFTSEENVVGNMFTQFIINKYDKLISPEDMLRKDWEWVENKIASSVYDKDKNYIPVVASILSTRFLNYIDKVYSQKGYESNPINNRVLEFLNSKKQVFAEDIIFRIIRQLVVKYPKQSKKLTQNPVVLQKVIIN